LRLTATEQARDHRAQAVRRDAGNRQADFGAGLTRWQRLRKVADDQQTAVADLHLRQALGVFCQLVATGRQQLSGDDFFAQWLTERKLSAGFGSARLLPQLRFGALIHGLWAKR
jgi:hypothetical protein